MSADASQARERDIATQSNGTGDTVSWRPCNLKDFPGAQKVSAAIVKARRSPADLAQAWRRPRLPRARPVADGFSSARRDGIGGWRDEPATAMSLPVARKPLVMRTLVVAILGIALLAGCSQHQPPAAPPATVAPAPGPAGVTVSAAQIPAEFLGGFAGTSVPTGFDGGEPNIGVTSKGNVYVTAFQNVVKSADGGKTWAVVPNPTGPPTTLDPMLWVDTATDRIFSNQLFVGCSYQSYSDDEGATWVPSPVACGDPGIDHQKVATGPYPTSAPQSSLSAAYKDIVSYCYNKIMATDCAISLDGGLHFEVDTVVDSGNIAPNIDTPLSCGGLNGHQHHAADGTIYVPYGFNCGQAYVGVSTDGGLTWTTHRTGLPSLYVDMDMTSTPDGMAYLFAKDNNQTVYMARSKDHFATVQGPFRVSPPEVSGTMYTVMSGGSDGRLAFAYLGNKQNTNNSLEDDMGLDTVWNLYVTMTVDAEATPPTFVTTQVNPLNDPVQRGAICMSRGCHDGDRNMLDFIDSAVGPDGRFWVVYTDGCTSHSCTTPGARMQSTDSMVSVARIIQGPSLFADKPPITT
jgi:hypothetical protein